MGIGITAIGPTATNIKVGKNIGYWTGELRSQVPYLSRQQPAITAVLNTRVRIDFASLTLKPEHSRVNCKRHDTLAVTGTPQKSAGEVMSDLNAAL